MRGIRIGIVLWLALASASALRAADATVEIVIGDDYRTSRFSYAIPEKDAFSMELPRRKVDELTDKAKSDFAEAQGYSRARYGAENWKVLSSVYVKGVTLKRGGRSRSLRGNIWAPEDSHQDGWAEPDRAATPEPGEPAGSDLPEPDDGE